ncbi:hypothetical protein AK812_SmicGene40113 [Symbiodinium microadriaticum]|uniref:Uncharacterized protein n=1 Tax=Symbiodinium microadriaticum TaxID=2951 RepID=A0A1Q9C9I9_SYMMI|nr:hypothetical protein AK812_SmicGene40113 [Symbiodinium microadriaticum]
MEKCWQGTWTMGVRSLVGKESQVQGGPDAAGLTPRVAEPSQGDMDSPKAWTAKKPRTSFPDATGTLRTAGRLPDGHPRIIRLFAGVGGRLLLHEGAGCLWHLAHGLLPGVRVATAAVLIQVKCSLVSESELITEKLNDREAHRQKK